MKKYLLLISYLFMVLPATAQEVSIMKGRDIRLNFITKDSVTIPLNENFELIDNYCSQITCYAHLDLKTQKFFGKIKAVSGSNLSQLVAEGGYTADGLKDGEFVIYFLNGKLQAKGTFKNGAYTGNWNIFYADGNPRLVFNADENGLQITGAWDASGKKTVENGKGNYRIEGLLIWYGKILNGKRDGKWHAVRRGDATNTDFLTENFKNGTFKSGTGPAGDYNDGSRLQLIDDGLMPFNHVEKFAVAPPCNSVATHYKNVVNASYRFGFESFNDEINNVVMPYLGKVDIRSLDRDITIEGTVSEYGAINSLITKGQYHEDIANGLVLQLRKLPQLTPASIDGKPVKQQILIQFHFSSGSYSFGYRLLPIAAN